MMDKRQRSTSDILVVVFPLTLVIFFIFLARVIFSPLLVPMQAELRLSHTSAGSLFLCISMGYAPTMLCSGFVSSRITHYGTILLSATICGLSLLVISFNSKLIGLQLGMFTLGVGAGLYFPSGMATLTHLVKKEHWGKAIAFHEAGPNLGFVLAPLVVELGLNFYSWRGIVISLGVSCLVVATVFALFGLEGRFRSEPPNFTNVKLICCRPSFWRIAIMLSLCFAANMGIYSILPIYLISERGMDQTLVNTIIGFSRLSGFFTLFGAGWLADRFGAELVMRYIYIASGLSTVFLGLASNLWLIFTVFLQPIVTTSFFPVSVSALANTASSRTRDIAISLMIPFVYLFGAGIAPIGMSAMGQYYKFEIGLILVGTFLLFSLLPLKFLHTRFS
tara:strand:+ start:316 stop:1491 length:1176 start_codon:yes stop_codon:yes gene_type:complete